LTSSRKNHGPGFSDLGSSSSRLLKRARARVHGNPVTYSLSLSLSLFFLLSLFLSRHGSTLPTRWTLLCRGADPLHLDSTCQRYLDDANARPLARSPTKSPDTGCLETRTRTTFIGRRFYAERERDRDVARIVFVVDGNAVLFNRARINNWQQAHVDFRTVANASYASVIRTTRGRAIARESHARLVRLERVVCYARSLTFKPLYMSKIRKMRTLREYDHVIRKPSNRHRYSTYRLRNYK